MTIQLYHTKKEWDLIKPENMRSINTHFVRLCHKNMGQLPMPPEEPINSDIIVRDVVNLKFHIYDKEIIEKIRKYSNYLNVRESYFVKLMTTYPLLIEKIKNIQF